jgi:hypothetical protein
MKLELKTDPETKMPVMTEQGAFVYVDADDNGKELPLDPIQMYGKIANLGKENQGHREKIKTMTGKLSFLDGIEDIEDWKKKADEALVKVENWKDADYVKAEKVQKLKDEITSAYEDKLSAKDTAIQEQQATHTAEVEKLNGTIRTLMISNKFSSSKYFGNDGLTTIVDPAMAESFFGKNFKVETNDNGEPITRAYFNNGDQVLSKVNPGEPAEFEEAIGLIIDAYPGKDSIMKSSGGGSGAGGGQGSQGGSDDLQSLRKQHQTALKENNIQLAVTLKNKIFAEEQRLKRNG